jgi:hypothetical protein
MRIVLTNRDRTVQLMMLSHLSCCCNAFTLLKTSDGWSLGRSSAFKCSSPAPPVCCSCNLTLYLFSLLTASDILHAWPCSPGIVHLGQSEALPHTHTHTSLYLPLPLSRARPVCLFSPAPPSVSVCVVCVPVGRPQVPAHACVPSPLLCA